MKKLLVLLTIFLFVCACDSSNGNSDSAPKANTANPVGIWTGEAGSDHGYGYVQTFFLEDGRFYTIYAGDNRMRYPSNIIAGKGTSVDGVFTSTVASDFDMDNGDIVNCELSAKFTAGAILESTFKYKTVNLTTHESQKYSPASNETTNMAGIGDNWFGYSEWYGPSEVYINSNGSVEIEHQGCVAKGSISPRASGNIFDISFKFENSSCYPSSTVFKGIAYYYDNNKRIAVLTNDSTYSIGVMFTGVNTINTY